MNKRYIYLFMIIGLFYSCSSSELVENWKNPEIDTFEAQKVLVIGISSNDSNRKVFEKKLVTELGKNGVNAVRSLDFFEETFTSTPRTEEDILALESQLVEKEFDAILLSKVVRIEDKVSTVQAYRNLDKTFNNFRDDYYENQEIYYNDGYYEEYQVFHAESSLYCICSDKDKELIWKGSIDITEPENIKKAVGDYIKVLVWALKGQRLLIIEDFEDEDIDL
ncbi:hypothetical protein D1816_18810 [Aquimarina sp. AD10]|uniref:Cardiolipin synthetase n=2 Tax=Flavobacteriaceae TaxID=49546 RepID=A0A162ZSZ6_9FLAO|nr:MULTISPECIES: hypothetical protein [Aquimarina]AXT62326.1 hypothetical protein D1816_18810 [Aquimarina sp. AD10]KZS40010.1 cardiolipin synthetase [Aquimarina aggregata]RKM90478.1 hypothetical protein D7033_23570 [Aquimarina sp. AD10]